MMYYLEFAVICSNSVHWQQRIVIVERTMLDHISKRLPAVSALLVMSALAGIWMCLSDGQAQPTQGASGCRSPGETARFKEIRLRIAATEKRVRDGEVAQAAVRPELDTLRKELAALLRKRPCPLQTLPGGGKGDQSAATGMIVDDCEVINCDCGNINAGLLSGPWRKECQNRESELKKMCLASHYINDTCHDTASGPNAFPR